MTIQEADDNRKWIKAVEERIKDQVDESGVSYADLDAYVGPIHLYISTFTSLHVHIYVYFDESAKLLFEIYSEGLVHDRSNTIVYSLGTRFNLDTEGISLLIDALKRTENLDFDSCLEAIKETERLYSEKFRGKIAGNKFGF